MPSLFGWNPFADMANAFVAALTHAAIWALGGLTHALVATTSANFTGPGFAPAWAAGRAVAIVVAVPLLLIGVMHAAITRSLERLGRTLGMLFASGIGMIVALAAAQGIEDLVTYCCGLMVSASGQAPARGIGRLSAILLTGGAAAGVPGAVVALVAIAALLGALVIWIELALAHFAALLVMVFVPMGLVSLTWGIGERFFKRLAEVLLALLAVPLVITAALVVGGSLLANGAVSLLAPGAAIDTLAGGIAVLGLGTLGLPAALRLSHLAVEASPIAGHGSRLGTQVATLPTRAADYAAVSAGASALSGGAGAAGGVAGAAQAGAIGAKVPTQPRGSAA
jgi:hypothetical protein